MYSRCWGHSIIYRHLVQWISWILESLNPESVVPLAKLLTPHHSPGLAASAELCICQWISYAH